MGKFKELLMRDKSMELLMRNGRVHRATYENGKSTELLMKMGKSTELI